VRGAGGYPKFHGSAGQGAGKLFFRESLQAPALQIRQAAGRAAAAAADPAPARIPAGAGQRSTRQGSASREVKDPQQIPEQADQEAGDPQILDAAGREAEDPEGQGTPGR